MDKLKPCPHCGCVSVTEEHATFKNPAQSRCAIVCEGCGAYGGPALGSDVNSTAETATGLWNKRAGIDETMEAIRSIMRVGVAAGVTLEEMEALLSELSGMSIEDIAKSIAKNIRALKEA